jgi:hypothetical protein
VADIDVLETSETALKNEIELLNRKLGEREDPIDAINRFLDEVERPVGKVTFDVVHGARTDRAILGLFDAAGRRL